MVWLEGEWVVMIDLDTQLTIGGICAGIIFAGGVVVKFTKLLTRVEDNEKKSDELLDAFELQKQAYTILNDVLQTTRMDMIKSYATMEHMRSLERKMDDVTGTVQEVEKIQASQGATLKAIHETVSEIRNRA